MFELLFIISFILIQLYYQYKYQNIINNLILDKKAEILKINIICERLFIPIINNNIFIFINYYLNISFIILLLECLLILINIITYNILLTIILYLLIIVLIFMLFISYNYNNNELIIINSKIDEIKNKKNEINDIYINKLLVIIDNDENIDYINNSIDEYISNYTYLYNYNLDKYILINFNLKDNLIKKKENELTIIMKSKLKNFTEIINDIVKYELDIYNTDLNNYKKSLELKIIKINEVSQINSFIINIS